MESIKELTTKLQTSTASSATLPDAEWKLRHDVLGQILVAYRESVQFNQQDGEDEEAETLAFETRIAAWIPVTSCIPVNRMFECYVHAMQNRQSSFPLAAQELVQSWRAVQDRNETYGEQLDKSHLLPENAAAACQRCFGTGREQLLGGGVKDNCSHEPLTKDEENARIRERVEQVRLMREESLKRGASEVKPVVKREPRGKKLKCDSCGRKASTFVGWREGEKCGQLLRMDGETPVTCEGKMLEV